MNLNQLIKTEKNHTESMKRDLLSLIQENVFGSQALIVYKFPNLEKIKSECGCSTLVVNPSNTYDYLFAFRPVKEHKDLMELAEAFKKDNNLDYAGIPLSSDDILLSTTKKFPTNKSVKALIHKYRKANDFLHEVFDSFGDYFDLELSVDEKFKSNIIKLLK